MNLVLFPGNVKFCLSRAPLVVNWLKVAATSVPPSASSLRHARRQGRRQAQGNRFRGYTLAWDVLVWATFYAQGTYWKRTH